MRKMEVILAVALGTTAMAAQGCTAVMAGARAAGTVAYVKGDLESVESARIEKVYDAVLKACDELQLAVIEKSEDAMSAKIIARDSSDDKITISLAATGEGTTRVAIRVGVFGSESKSKQVYGQIKKHL